MHWESNRASKLAVRVGAAVARCGVPVRGTTVLVACSGGPDSVCLLSVLRELAPSMQWNLVVGHVDHGMRASSGKDRLWVEQLASDWGLPFVSRAVSLQSGSEEEARRLRYAALESMAAHVGASAVALGHHLDDQAETVLMRLLRGTGLRGTSGMSVRRGLFVRPLLEERRATLMAYLADRNISYLEDETNSDRALLRNWVRHEVLPLLSSRNPRVATALASFATNQRRDLETLDSAMALLSDRYLQKASCMDGRVGVKIAAAAAIQKVGEGGLWWLLRHAHGLVRGAGQGGRPGKQLGRDHFDALLSVLDAQGEKRVCLPGGAVAVTVPGGLALLPDAWLSQDLSFGVSVTDPGHLRLGGTGWHLVVERDFWARVRGGLIATVAWPGARLAWGGKLQDHYVDLKVPKLLRPRLPLLKEGDRVMWAVGRGRDGPKILVENGSVEQALVTLCWPEAERLGIFDLSQAGLSVTTKAKETAGDRVVGNETDSSERPPGSLNEEGVGQ